MPAKTAQLQVREAAARVALRVDVPAGWLNVAVKRWMGDRGRFAPWLELPHLSVFVAHTAYLLAMKCMALRLGAEFQDLDDIRYLLRHLDIGCAADALAVVAQYVLVRLVPMEEPRPMRSGAGVNHRCPAV